MGYTHYFTQTRDYTDDEWPQVLEDIGQIIAYAENEQNVAIRNWDGKDKPELTGDYINFNGAGDDSCENFIVERIRQECEFSGLGSHFCKTNRKPYDLVITAVLCYLESVCETHTVGSDGSGADYVQGLELARQALPRYANMLDIPRKIMENDRWIGPWFDSYADGYDLNLCVDGYAYITGPKNASYRFYSHHEAAQWAASHKEKPITVTTGWGTRAEGGGCLFKPFGSFNEKRTKALGTQQRALFKAMLAKAEGDRAIPPPAFIRPGDMPVIDHSVRARSFEDLLKLADKEAA